MCGRYIFSEEPKRLYRRFDADSSKKQLDFKPSYNIAPGSLVPIIIRKSPNQLEIMKWGLIPHWAKDPKMGYKMINARAETVDKKPSFRSSFKIKRCLVPATGFYEWKKTTEGKTPYLIRLKTKKIFSFAGIFDEWKDVEGKKFRTFTIITTKPNSLVEPIHNRMPVILNPEKESVWLDKNTDMDTLKDLLIPFPSKNMEAYRVSTKVNSPKNQGKELVQKV